MPPTTFGIQFVGTGLRLDTVPLRELLTVLEDLDQLVNRSAQQVTGEDCPGELSLAGIADGSIEITFQGNASHVRGARFLTEQVKKNDQHAPSWMRKRVRSLWRFARDNRCEIRLSRGQLGNGDPLVAPNREPFEPPILVGGTSIVGTVLRAGGRNPPTAQLQLADGTKLTVYLSGEEMAKQLGERLYQTVALDGTATWDTSDWSIDTFKAAKIGDYAEKPLAATFAALAELSAGRWDHTDPEGYVRSLRDDPVAK